MTATTIPTARLGAAGPEVGVQGLGCMGMSFAYGPSDAKQSQAALDRAFELGVTLYDTADAYGVGENERFLSPFFKAHRDQLVIATKFALSIPPGDPTRRVIRNDRPYIRQAVEGSLQRSTSTSSTSTTCTAATRPSPSRTPSARWRNWWPRARSSTWA